MRRTSGPQTGCSAFYFKKETAKMKSPAARKSKSRNKLTQNYSTNNLISRTKGSSFCKAETNQSSTFFTHNNNKTKKTEPQAKKGQNLKKYEKQIMQVLNSSAAVIQREWRKYLIRKYRRSLQTTLERKQNKNNLLSSNEQQQYSSRTSQNSQSYNNQKYCPCEQKLQKKQNNNFMFNLNDKTSNYQSQNRSKIRYTHQKQSNLSSHSSFQKFESSQYLRKKELGSLKNIQKSQKHLQFANNIFSVSIVNEHQSKVQKQPIISSRSQNRYQDHYVKNEREQIHKIVQKLQAKLEEKKFKKMLALQNSFNSNLMTFRSYQKNHESIAEEHTKQLHILQRKKKKLIQKFHELVDICETNFEESSIKKKKINKRSYDDEIQMNENIDLDVSFNQSASEAKSGSIAFEDWEFGQPESSKKQQSVSKLLDPKNFVKQQRHEQILINDGQNVSASKEVSEEYQIKNQQEFGISSPIQKINLVEGLSSESQRNQKAQQNIQIEQPKKKQTVPIKNEEQEAEIVVNKKKQQQKQKYSIQQIAQQLKRMHPINPSIDVVNNWLLEISHYILDNHSHDFLSKLVDIEQPSSSKLFECCKRLENWNQDYISISPHIFSLFQRKHVTNLAREQQLQGAKKQCYIELMNIFQRSLYDCLNKMLTDQLIEGRNWINYPWNFQFKPKKLVGPEHSKQALQKSINRVSNMSDYNLPPFQFNPLISGQFQQTHHNLIFTEEVKQMPVESEIFKGNLTYLISQAIQQQIFVQEVCNILKLIK